MNLRKMGREKNAHSSCPIQPRWEP